MAGAPAPGMAIFICTTIRGYPVLLSSKRPHPLHILGLIRGVVSSQNQGVYAVQTEKIEEVPRQRRNPSNVHVWSVDASLQHCLEADSKWERQTCCIDIRSATVGET